MAPLWASKANRLLRASIVWLPAACTWVKEPPTTIVFPTWMITRTTPSNTWGVQSAG